MGDFTKQIRKLQEQFYKNTPLNNEGRVRGHLAKRDTCIKCGKAHSLNEHRFHGPMSHLRTHGYDYSSMSEKSQKGFLGPPPPMTYGKKKGKKK